MVTEWTIRRVTVNKHEQPSWEVWESVPARGELAAPGSLGSACVLRSGTLLGLLADFPDFVLSEFAGIAKEVTEA
jgi:hypothetical protein